MGLRSLFKSEATLSMREQTLIALAVYSTLKDEEGLARVRASAKDAGLPDKVLSQVEAAIDAVAMEVKEGISLEEAIATANSCCGS